MDRQIAAWMFLSLFACAAAAAGPSIEPPGYFRHSADGSNDTVIIFIHGFFGNGVDTWTNEQAGTYWPQLIADDPAFAGADIYVDNFPSPLRSRAYTIDELGGVLRRHLEADDVIASHKHVIFLCHSMGGLVVRAYLLKARPAPERIAMIYFFSTPTNGARLAKLARFFSRNPQLVDLRPITTGKSGTIDIFQSQWVESGYAKAVRSYCAYEVLATRGFLIVDRGTATSLCNEHLDPIHANHFMIVKPATVRDESHLAFRSAYRATMLEIRAGNAWKTVPVSVPDQGHLVFTWNDVQLVGTKGWLAGAKHTGGGDGQALGNGVLLYSVDAGVNWTPITQNIEYDEGTLAGWGQRWKGIGPITSIDVYPRLRTEGDRVMEGWLASATGIYSSSDATQGRWERVTPHPSEEPFAQFVRMANIEAFREIYAVGWPGITHWERGGQWEFQKPTGNYLIGDVTVSGGSQPDVWAVGRTGLDPDGRAGSDSRGAIYHLQWPETEWHLVETGIELDPEQGYTAIAVQDRDVVIAVGQGGLIVRGRRTGTAWGWSRSQSGTTEHLTSVAADGEALWVVGWNGTILMSNDRGAMWERVEVEDANGRELQRIRFFKDSGWIVGDQIVLKRER